MVPGPRRHGAGGVSGCAAPCAGGHERTCQRARVLLLHAPACCTRQRVCLKGSSPAGCRPSCGSHLLAATPPRYLPCPPLQHAALPTSPASTGSERMRRGRRKVGTGVGTRRARALCRHIVLAAAPERSSALPSCTSLPLCPTAPCAPPPLLPRAARRCCWTKLGGR